MGPPLRMVVIGLAYPYDCHSLLESPTLLPPRSSGLCVSFSPTLQVLSRNGIVLRELLSSTNPIGLRAEEPFISDRALGNRGSLLFQDHRLGSVVAGNSHLILR